MVAVTTPKGWCEGGDVVPHKIGKLAGTTVFVGYNEDAAADWGFPPKENARD